MKNFKVIKIILGLSIVFSSIIYASYNTNLYISGDAYLRKSGEMVRITNVSYIESSGEAIELYVPKYSKNTTSLFAELPAGTYIKYSINISNKTNKDYIISSINEISHNTNLTYEYSLKVEEDIIDAPTGGASEATESFTITITNNGSSTQVETLVLQYNFEELKYTASDLIYYNELSTKCSSNRTSQCALDELAGLID